MQRIWGLFPPPQDRRVLSSVKNSAESKTADRSPPFSNVVSKRLLRGFDDRLIRLLVAFGGSVFAGLETRAAWTARLANRLFVGFRRVACGRSDLLDNRCRG